MTGEGDGRGVTITVGQDGTMIGARTKPPTAAEQLGYARGCLEGLLANLKELQLRPSHMGIVDQLSDQARAMVATLWGLEKMREKEREPR